MWTAVVSELLLLRQEVQMGQLTNKQSLSQEDIRVLAKTYCLFSKQRSL